MVAFILFIVLFPIIPAATSTSDYERSSTPIINAIASQGTDPIIYINTDNGFSSLGVPGDGSESNPYLIEDMQIVSAGFCITIIGTRAYFIIRNCTLSGGGTGIRFILVENARIENCTFIDLEIGIEWNYPTNSSVSLSNFVDTFDCIILSNAVNCIFEVIDVERNSNGGADFQCSDSEDIEIRVFNCTNVYNNTESIHLSKSNRVTISHLSTGNPSIGIMVLESSYVEIYNSSLTGRLKAVQIYLSSFCNLRNSSIVADLEQVNIVDSEICAIMQCTFISGVHGQITIDFSENCLIQDCTLLNSSLKILGDHLGYYSHIISNVTNNGEEIGYFLNTNSIAINMSKYYQVFVISCHNVTSKLSSMPSELFSLDIRFSESCNFDNISIIDNVYSSINIADSQNIEMSNFSMNGSWYGVNIHESLNISIVSAKMFENALNIWQSSNVSVFNSDIYNLVVFWSFNSKIVNSNITELYVSQSSGCQFFDLQIVYPVQFSGNYPTYWLNTFTDVYVNRTLLGYFYNINNTAIDPSAFGQVVIAYCSSIIMVQYTELFRLDIFDSDDLFISDIIIIDGMKNGIQIYDSVSVYFNQITFEGNSSFEIITSSEIWIVSSRFFDSRIHFSAFGNYIVLDCFFTNCVLELNNIQNLEFARNTVNSGIGDGMHIARVVNAEIRNNTFTTRDSGIRGQFISDSQLSFNQIDCNLDGIIGEALSNMSIDYNSIFNARFGLNITSGSLLEIKNN
ncbi:MAG: right-handed parallel beta-helix repeat-containing protein, partial [Candidatus Thorarchaeota archaeon]